MQSSLVEKDKLFIWHPFTPLQSSPDPIPIVRGEGIYLIDEQGNRYIDGISSWWVNIHGHAHPYIAKKIYEQALQLEQVIFAGFTHPPAVELAERLLGILPQGFSKIFYSDNGSTSTEVAIKMALQFWWNKADNNVAKKRNKVLAFNNAYHGDTFGAMSVSDRSVFTKAFHDHLFEVIFIDTPTVENLAESRKIIAEHSSDIAAFIYEPLLQGASGMKLYDASAMDELLKSIQEEGIICIADEVMTGFGRTGKLFASEYMINKPDIICLSKGLTGGTMALGVTACSQKIVDAFISDDKLKTFFHGHSFTANPIACASAIASMDLLEKETCFSAIQNIVRSHDLFVAELKSQYSKVKNARQLGTIMAFEIDNGKDEYLNNISRTITAQLLKKGVYLRPLGNTVYIMPPYCISTEELQKIYAAIVDMLNDF